MKLAANIGILQVLRRGVFCAVSRAIGIVLVSVLILLWAVTWPMFEFSDWVTREVAESRAKKSKAKLIRKEIGLGPWVVGRVLIFIASVRQTRQLARISRIRRSRGNFDDWAGGASMTGEPAPPATGGDQHPIFEPMVEKMTARQGGLV